MEPKQLGGWLPIIIAMIAAVFFVITVIAKILGWFSP
jgi:hypothetical protein